MVNYDIQFRNLLLEAVDCEVYYEYFTEKVATPCVSYMESSNQTTAKGDSLKLSEITYLVKVWCGTIDKLNEITEAIDAKLEANGFTRVSANDAVEDKLLVKYLRYSALGYQKLN